MPMPDDDSTAPRLSDPFEPSRQTVAESEPPTALVRRFAVHVTGDNCIELPPGSLVAETYEIAAMIGAGGMGEVYAARHVKLDKRVAIKVIGPRLSEDGAAIERFAREARTLAKIQHPAIVAVEHVGELADGRAFFVMEYLYGESLFERLSRGRIPLAEALRMLDQLARGLEAAHAHEVIHRDLKPENIFLVRLPGESPMIKLVDFGLAKLRVQDQRAERTQSGVAIGTPMYMSPEQARGPDVDHRTDIYALGCVAYELVLGVPPFPHARTTPELYAAHLHESPPLPRSIWPEIPPQLDLCLFAMLAKDPAHRPTLAQVRAVVAAARSSTPSQRAQTEFVGLRAAKPRRFTIVAAVGALITLVVGITIGGLMVTRADKVPIDTNANVPPPSSAHAAPTPTTPPVAAPVAGPSETSRATDPKPPPPLKKPQNIRTSRFSTTRGQTKASSGASGASVSGMPTDAGVEVQPVPDKTRSKVDRNQTINPFKRKVHP